jgi:hypothetical protein
MWENIIAIHNVLRKKTTKLNCQLVQYWKNKINKENLKKKTKKKKEDNLGEKTKKNRKKKTCEESYSTFPTRFKILGKIDVKSEISHLKHLEFDKGMLEAIKKVFEINFLNVLKGSVKWVERVEWTEATKQIVCSAWRSYRHKKKDLAMKLCRMM